MAVLKITLRRSYAGCSERQRRVVRSLGLRRLHQTVVHEDSPTIIGMVNKVIHMVNVEIGTEDDAPHRSGEGAR